MAAYVDACVTQLHRAHEEGLGAAATVFCRRWHPLPAACEPSSHDCSTQSSGEDGAEVTVECNPEDVTVQAPAHLRRGGSEPRSRSECSPSSRTCSRVSVAGTDPDGGADGPSRPSAEVGFSSFSVDLIYGAAGETDIDWAATLEGVLGLDPSPPHVSAYALQAEPGTPLWRDPARHPDDDVQARRYEIADERARGRGTQLVRDLQLVATGPRVPAQPELLAPRRVPRRGLRGAQPHRRSQVLEHPDSGALRGRDGRRQPAVAGEERLDPEQRLLEALELAIRTREGVDETALADDEAAVGLVHAMAAARC